ncbi:MAG TPA: iron ABC transporter permease, partial [Planctomycetes bacterium]|nr:iron ABC transporter permease [Planctomycetota bacterium]
PAWIFWKLRLPRSLAAALAGAGLSAAGMGFQALFRNPLATPFTLGVASGASLGAALYYKFGIAFSLLFLSGTTLAALAGALLAVLVVYKIANLQKAFGTQTLLLAGVAISLFFSSLILFAQFLSSFTSSVQILHWLMGGLDVLGYEPVLTLAVFVLPFLLLLLLRSRELDLMTTGEDLAQSRGVEVVRAKKLLFFANSAMVGGIVSITGPIGFVGLIGPHLARLLVSPSHRYLAPAAMLLGASLLVLCDTLARSLIAPAELPVGILTALLGGPFFLWLLVSRRTLR